MRCLLVALSLAVLPLQAAGQQNWGNLDVMLQQSLAPGATFERSFWLPDNADPAQARIAVGVIYPIIVGAAGNTGISVGVFSRHGAGWGLMGQIDNLYGHNPREARFGAGFIELTTTTLGPNEPRCCPTVVSRWRIDLNTMTVKQIE